jgi:choline dehydrogenase-like flavoprotein
MPYADLDIGDWPVGNRELAPHYEACARLLDVSAASDDLADEYPLHTSQTGQPAVSAQAQRLFGALARNRDPLAAAGVRFGGARLAVRASGPGGGCVLCGLCLHGCPEDVIFRTPTLIDAYIREGRLTYRPGVVVETVSEEGDAATVRGYHLGTSTAFAINAKRIFIACGPIPTTSILMRSAKLYNKRLTLKDSQYFVLPLLTAAATHGLRDERLHTLSQAFLRILDEGMGSRRTYFLQVYSYNSLLAAELRRKLLGIEFLVRPLLARLMIAQGYLHSDLSGGIDVTLEGGPGADRVRLSPVDNVATRHAIRNVLRKLFRIARWTGAAPLPPLLRVGEPGRGFHSGGSLPMRANPGPYDTDTMGRPFGWRRIHAVDASVLPSIAATTITFPVMANAHRIATEAAGQDRFD